MSYELYALEQFFLVPTKHSQEHGPTMIEIPEKRHRYSDKSLLGKF